MCECGEVTFHPAVSVVLTEAVRAPPPYTRPQHLDTARTLDCFFSTVATPSLLTRY